jgi:hypothetical protein
LGRELGDVLIPGRERRGEAALLLAARLDWGGMEADGEVFIRETPRKLVDGWLVTNLGHISMEGPSISNGHRIRISAVLALFRNIIEVLNVLQVELL